MHPAAAMSPYHADMAADDYLDPYRRAVEEHGASFKATLWGSERAQHLRFDVIMEAIRPDAGTVVLDAGCGRGDLAARMLERDVPFGGYIGIDAVEAMIHSAAARELARSRFLAADFVKHPHVLEEHEADWIVFSGALNTMDDPTARGLIETSFAAARTGVAFNFLSDRPHDRWTGRDLTPARRFDTLAWLDWALGRTSRVAFRQDYLDGHDATIVMRREDDLAGS